MGHAIRWHRLTLVLPLLGFAGDLFGAELIKVPSGVVVRSLFAWEGTASLEVSLGNALQPVTRTLLGADFSLSNEDLCEAAAYRTSTESGVGAFIDLSHLCDKPTAGSVTFALIADPQELHDEHQKSALLLNELVARHPEVKFVVTAGDIVDTGTDGEWRRYRQVATSYTHRLPIVPVLGNHEFFDDPNLEGFNKVYRTEQTAKDYYVLDLGPAALIVLNSNMDRLSPAERAAQTTWLAETLATYAPQKPVLASYHHPAYSTGIASIFMPAPPKYIREQWLPLFARHGVKLVMNGHEHVYERLLIEGVHYVNAGPAGGDYGRILPYQTPYTQKVLKNHRTVTLVTVETTGAVQLQTYAPDQDGALVDDYGF